MNDAVGWGAVEWTSLLVFCVFEVIIGNPCQMLPIFSNHEYFRLDSICQVVSSPTLLSVQFFRTATRIVW